MRAKFVNEEFNQGPASLYALEYQRIMDHAIPDFKEYTLADLYGPGSDWYEDAKYYAYSDDEEYSNWSKDDAALEIKFFENMIKQGKGDWGTWMSHSEDSEFGGIYGDREEDDPDYFDVERSVLEKGNFEKYTDRLFYDEKANTGYYIEEKDSWATPEYYVWFFAVK